MKCWRCPATRPGRVGWVTIHAEHVPAFERRFCSFTCLVIWSNDR
jgi:hypothetical protein